MEIELGKWWEFLQSRYKRLPQCVFQKWEIFSGLFLPWIRVNGNLWFSGILYSYLNIFKLKIYWIRFLISDLVLRLHNSSITVTDITVLRAWRWRIYCYKNYKLSIPSFVELWVPQLRRKGEISIPTTFENSEIWSTSRFVHCHRIWAWSCWSEVVGFIFWNIFLLIQQLLLLILLNCRTPCIDRWLACKYCTL